MASDNVVPFPGLQYGPVPARQTLESAIDADIDEVLVIGWQGKDLYFAGNTSDTREIIWLLEKARKWILEQI
jgi:hypothetical protein